MGRTDYILRSLAKISKKRWEHYAITRIYHRLDDPKIEFVCQQCIRKDDKEFYLADLFFPQLKLYLEIDEGHHETDQNKIRDAKRRLDITEATDLKEVRIPACGVTLGELNASIDDFVELVRQRKAKAVLNDEFYDWDYERRFTSAPHHEVGFIEIGPHSAFRTHRDGLNCFGYSKGNYQKAVWNLPEKVVEAVGLSGSCMVWFPHLYHHDQWDNSLSDDGLVITEINKDMERVYREPWDKRIEPPPLKCSAPIVRKRRTINGHQETQARRDCREVTAG
jgi:very-short-patch-repair endonuclease